MKVSKGLQKLIVGVVFVASAATGGLNALAKRNNPDFDKLPKSAQEAIIEDYKNLNDSLNKIGEKINSGNVQGAVNEYNKARRFLAELKPVDGTANFIDRELQQVMEAFPYIMKRQEIVYQLEKYVRENKDGMKDDASMSVFVNKVYKLSWNPYETHGFLKTKVADSPDDVSKKVWNTVIDAMVLLKQDELKILQDAVKAMEDKKASMNEAKFVELRSPILKCQNLVQRSIENMLSEKK